MSTAVAIELAPVTCSVCGCTFGLPSHMQQSKMKVGGDFYCPNGHSQTYGDTHYKRLQRELAQVKSQLDQTEAKAKQAEKELAKAKKQTACGQCPVCERSFRSLRTHMANRHPEYVTEAEK